MANQNRPRPFDTLSQAIAYLLGGIFIYTADLTGALTWGAHILGGAFMAFAFFLLIASSFDRLIAWVRTIDRELFLGLFVAMIARLIITAVKGPEELIWVVIVFLFLTLLTFLFNIFRSTRDVAANQGNRVAAARISRALALLFGASALVMVIMQVDLYGGPVLHLALSVVFLLISLPVPS